MFIICVKCEKGERWGKSVSLPCGRALLSNLVHSYPLQLRALIYILPFIIPSLVIRPTSHHITSPFTCIRSSLAHSDTHCRPLRIQQIHHGFKHGNLFKSFEEIQVCGPLCTIFPRATSLQIFSHYELLLTHCIRLVFLGEQSGSSLSHALLSEEDRTLEWLI